MFPEFPLWIAKILPTNDAIEPVIENAREGAGWVEVAPEVGLWLAFTGLLRF